MVANCSGERSFSKFKRIENELKGRSVPAEVVNTNIRYIKSYKLRQTNCNEYLDNLVMKKAGQAFLLCYVQP